MRDLGCVSNHRPFTFVILQLLQHVFINIIHDQSLDKIKLYPDPGVL